MEGGREPNVDENGTLLRLPEEGEVEPHLEWVGEGSVVPRSADDPEDLVKEYKALRVYDQTIESGDIVYLRGEEVPSACEIGLVLRLFEDEGEKTVRVQWFWRPEHFEKPITVKKEHAREIFLSDTSDENPAAAIERKVKVYHLTKGEKLPVALKEADTFFYRKHYDPEDGTFLPEPARVGNCLTAADGAPPAKKSRKRADADPEGSRPAKASAVVVESAESQQAVDQIIDKVETNRAEILSRIAEVAQLTKLVNEACAAQKSENEELTRQLAEFEFQRAQKTAA